MLVGDFTAVNSFTRNRVARLLTDGQVDTAFNPGSGADNFINAVAIQPNGAILIGGGFSSYTGTSRNGLARLTSSGALDTTFNPGAGINPGDTASSAIQAIALQSDGRIIIAGNFTTYNSVAINRVARLNADGSLDTTFNNLGSGPNDRVYSVAVDGSGRIILGGAFTSINGVLANRIARLNVDGSLDSSFSGLGAGPNGDVYAARLMEAGAS